MWSADQYDRVATRWQTEPASEWLPYWEYGAFVDVRDIAAAVERALEAPVEGHHRALLRADEIAARAPSLDAAARLAPGAAVTRPELYRTDSRLALVECAVAKSLLGWQPAHRWSQRGRPGS